MGATEMNNKTMFQEYMTGLGEIFGKEITDILKDIYWKALEPFTDEQCKDAFNEAFVKFKWFPKPAELIEDMIKQQPKIEHKALIEANKILEHLNFNGSRVHPKTDDPITKYLMPSQWP